MLTIDSDIYHSDQILALLQTNAHSLKFRQTRLCKAQKVMNQGDNIDDVLFIIQGTISLSRTSKSGRRYQLGSFKHNGFLGLMELFSGKPCFYSVTADSECQAYILDGKAFHNLVCHNPHLAAHTFKHLTSKWYLSVERMTRNILHSITYCVADDLLNFIAQNPNQAYVINKSLECERLGTSLRVYNRILKQLELRGAIKVQRKQIDILNSEVLVQVLNEEADK
ncbi:Crp/Fnr family transcriptional regulator [Vibrio ponticus]|uniref:Crp/Fnr family transcriptional regulator n=1 Tax=Vibrio ponticus TaxID=265668 RepID=A0A3N3DTZ0_9VIBR|nr:Crp/Fnr family transcriptional regulator [Vibrio ponticus]ROV57961.1 Crp/Fnr family transcriptional regulator [Vibrio ponticus]